jgi:hypothetical protein
MMMGMLRNLALLLAALVLTSQPAYAASSASCAKEAGYIGGPYVPSRDVAIAIYRAVAKAIAPDKVKEYPIIHVEDDGDRWTVSQTRREQDPRVKNGEVVVSTGGGGLSMSIDKCTGAVSQAAFSR